MGAPLAKSPAEDLYERDFALWCEETASLLRAGRFAEIDVEHAAEEIEAMARRDKREIRNRLKVLIQHLLKWERQPEKRKPGWQNTILTQRENLPLVLEDSPSLRAKVPDAIASAYKDAVSRAIMETGLPATAFPSQCPYSAEQLLDRDFLPGADPA